MRALICSAFCRPTATSWSWLTPQPPISAARATNVRRIVRERGRTRSGLLGLRRAGQQRVGNALALLFHAAEQKGEQVVVLDRGRLATHRQLLRRRDEVQGVESGGGSRPR